MEETNVINNQLDALHPDVSVGFILNSRHPSRYGRQDLDLTMRLTRFGSEGDHNLVPLIFDHTIGKNQSSFPALYNQGYYDPKTGYPELDVAYDEKRALVGGPTTRKGIQEVKKWHESNKPSIPNFLEVSKKLNLGHIEGKGPASLPLRQDRIRNFFTKVDEHKNRADSALARLLLDETTQIPFSEVFVALQKSAQLFLSENANKMKAEEWYLWLPTKKWGSEQWLAALLLPDLRQVPWTGLADESFQPAKDSIVNFVVVDDALYSGTHLLGTFDAYTYDLKQKPKELRLHFLVPFSTCMGNAALHDLVHIANQKEKWLDVHTYPVYRLNSIADLVTCQHDVLDKIRTLDEAEKVHFLKTKCPVLSKFDCSNYKHALFT